MVSYATIEDPKECLVESSDSPKVSTYRRVLYAVAGVSAFVAGAFFLTHRNVVDRAQSFRRRLAGHDDVESFYVDDLSVNEQEFLNEMLPRIQMAQSKKATTGSHLIPGNRRRIEGDSEEDIYIGMDVNTDMFYVVNVMNGLGKFVCAIYDPQGTRCNKPYKLPWYISADDVKALLQGLRDSDDGLDELKKFDATALATALRLVSRGRNEADTQLDRLDTIFDVQTALTSVQIAGNIAAAVLSLTPYTYAGAFMSMALTVGVELVEDFVTAGEIEDAQKSIAAAVFDMGKYAANSPELAYLQDFHDAETTVSIKMAKLYAGNSPISIGAGSDQIVLRRFMTGLARATDDLADMHTLLIDFHNAFDANPFDNFKLWKDVANSMIDVEQHDVQVRFIESKADDAQVNPELFAGFSNLLLSGGMVTSKKAKMWSKQTLAHKASTAPHAKNANLFKLRQLSENPKAPRKAAMYSRMTAGLSIMSAVIQSIGLGFQVAEQEDMLDRLTEDIQAQHDSLNAYYTNMHEAILNVESEAGPTFDSLPTEAPTHAPVMSASEQWHIIQSMRNRPRYPGGNGGRTFSAEQGRRL